MVTFVHENMFGNSSRPITQFIGKYKFLSNFYPCSIYYLDLNFISAEHAYHAAKTINKQQQIQIQQCKTPAQAKKLGKTVDLRPDWNKVKKQIMEEILILKFENIELQNMLLATKKRELIEGNTWKDVYWGVCNGKGQNNLGKLLMKIRDEYLLQGFTQWPKDLLSE